MLNTPKKEKSLFRGNLEALAEIFGSPFCDDDAFTNYLVGVLGLIRYNFRQPNWKITPYGQIGAGVVCTDGSEGEPQNDIDMPLEFNLQVGLGVRCPISEDWSINAELVLDHYSDGGSWRHLDVNSYGFNFGLTRHF